jgi:C1A family cysteine protease
MTAVAYGTENGIEYVVIQNSWGTTWGDMGYIKVQLITGIYGVCKLYYDNYLTLV